MKNIFLFSILLCAVALPAFSQLMQSDLDKISLIVNDAEKRIKKDIKADIVTSEKNIKEYINIKIDSIDKRLSTYNWVIYVLVPLIVAAIGIPSAIMAWRSGKDRYLEKQVEMLIQEVEALKQQRIVPS